jgi:hypothetical protein
MNLALLLFIVYHAATLAMLMNDLWRHSARDIRLTGLCPLAAPNLPASSKGVSRMNFVPLLLVHLCNTLPALAMLMIARCGVQPRQHVDCWSVSSPAAPNLASIIKVYHMNFVPCC